MSGSDVMSTVPSTRQSLSVNPVDVTVTEYVTVAVSPTPRVTVGWLTLFSMSQWYVRLKLGLAVIVTVQADAVGTATSPSATVASTSSLRTPLLSRKFSLPSRVWAASGVPDDELALRKATSDPVQRHARVGRSEWAPQPSASGR